MIKRNDRYEGPERRQYVRLASSAPMEVGYRAIDARDADGGRWRSPSRGGAGRADSHGVSGGGLFVHVGNVVPGVLDDLLHGRKHLVLDIRLPGASAVIGALARVMWAEGEEGAEGSSYGCGVSFLEIDEDDRDAVTNYVIDSHLAAAREEASGQESG